MLGALYARGVRADMLVGTSVGALNAAFIASRPQQPATAVELASVWRRLHRADVFPARPRGVLGALARGSDHLLPSGPLEHFIRPLLQYDRLEQADVPLHVVAFDLLSGQEVRLSEGPAVQALLAASAVPGILAPVHIGEQLLVDGGVANNTPISHAIELGAQRIYVLPTQDPRHGGSLVPHSAFDVALAAVAQLVSGRLRAEFDQYGRDAELIVLPAVNAGHVQPTDFGQAGQLTADARRAAEEELRLTTTA